MISKIFRVLAILAVALFLLGSGVVAGYVANDDSDGDTSGEKQAQAETQKLERQGQRTTQRLADVCRAGTWLRSGYTKKTIGHTERCDVRGNDVEPLISEICTDVLKASRRAHLPDAECKP